MRASRARLEHALTAAGLKTQAALAERIADLEALSAPPKDLVNRVFREQPVDPQSLERVARALGAPAHSLYQRSGDVPLPPPEPSEPTEPPPSGRRRRPLAAAAAAVLAIAVLGGALLWMGRGTVPEDAATVEQTADAGPISPPASAPALAVLPLDGDAGGRLAAALRDALAADFALASPAAELIVDPARPEGALASLRVDAAVGGSVTRRGRRVGVKLYLSRAGSRDLVWADSVAGRALPAKRGAVAREAARALRIALGVADEPAHYHPSEQGLEDFLIGWTHLDRSRTELNVKRALTRFESALRHSPDYPDALAGLCEALIQESIRGGETRYLDDAEPLCFRALQLEPSSVEALTAWGDWLRKTGRLDAAGQAYARALEDSPGHTDALLGRAELALARYRETRDEARARAAIDTARAAVGSAPGFWKPPYVLGRMLYYTGDVDGAVDALTKAKTIDANEHVLSNLGTFQFCQGDHAGALQNYLAVQRNAPQFYVGDVQLGAVRYFLGDYARAAELFSRALDKARADGRPEDHRIWGNLADAYRHDGDADAARSAYARAAALAERDAARGDNRANTGAYLAYYYTALLDYEPAGRNETTRAAVGEQLRAALDGATDVDALTRLAAALVLRGELDTARGLYPRITAQCKGFGASPDLAALRVEPRAD